MGTNSDMPHTYISQQTAKSSMFIEGALLSDITSTGTPKCSKDSTVMDK